MAEATEHASILIATSYQALNKVRTRQPDTLICNCVVVIIFAAFFIEANLSHIIKKMGGNEELQKFTTSKPGLGDKMAWFYNTNLARKKFAKNSFKRKKKKILTSVARRFPGFAKIYKFRNDVAHGIINREYRNAEKHRENAKRIVDELFKIAAEEGFLLKRTVTYDVAIRSRKLK